jgi:hypothetical protein
MKRIFWILLWFATVVSTFSATTKIKVGDVQLEIPSPNSFVPVTANMTNVSKFFEAWIASDETRFAAFISEADFQNATNNVFPKLVRWFSVEAMTKTIPLAFTTNQFFDFKNYFRKQNEELVRQVEKEMPGTIEELNSNIENQLEWNVKIKSINSFNSLPLPIHDESNYSIAFSMLVNSHIAGASQESKGYITAVTTTVIYVKGKMLFIYVNGGEKDLEWTRTQSADWVKAILATNS